MKIGDIVTIKATFKGLEDNILAPATLERYANQRGIIIKINYPPLSGKDKPTYTVVFNHLSTSGMYGNSRIFYKTDFVAGMEKEQKEEIQKLLNNLKSIGL